MPKEEFTYIVSVSTIVVAKSEEQAKKRARDLLIENVCSGEMTVRKENKCRKCYL